jgi:hypothetical protein
MNRGVVLDEDNGGFRRSYHASNSVIVRGDTFEDERGLAQSSKPDRKPAVPHPRSPAPKASTPHYASSTASSRAPRTHADPSFDSVKEASSFTAGTASKFARASTSGDHLKQATLHRGSVDDSSLHYSSQEFGSPPPSGPPSTTGSLSNSAAAKKLSSTRMRTSMNRCLRCHNLICSCLPVEATKPREKEERKLRYPLRQGRTDPQSIYAAQLELATKTAYFNVVFKRKLKALQIDEARHRGHTEALEEIAWEDMMNPVLSASDIEEAVQGDHTDHSQIQTELGGLGSPSVDARGSPPTLPTRKGARDDSVARKTKSRSVKVNLQRFGLNEFDDEEELYRNGAGCPDRKVRESYGTRKAEDPLMENDGDEEGEGEEASGDVSHSQIADSVQAQRRKTIAQVERFRRGEMSAATASIVTMKPTISQTSTTTTAASTTAVVSNTDTEGHAVEKPPVKPVRLSPRRSRSIPPPATIQQPPSTSLATAPPQPNPVHHQHLLTVEERLLAPPRSGAASSIPSHGSSDPSPLLVNEEYDSTLLAEALVRTRAEREEAENFSKHTSASLLEKRGSERSADKMNESDFLIRGEADPSDGEDGVDQEEEAEYEEVQVPVPSAEKFRRTDEPTAPPRQEERVFKQKSPPDPLNSVPQADAAVDALHSNEILARLQLLEAQVKHLSHDNQTLLMTLADSQKEVSRLHEKVEQSRSIPSAELPAAPFSEAKPVVDQGQQAPAGDPSEVVHFEDQSPSSILPPPATTAATEHAPIMGSTTTETVTQTASGSTGQTAAPTSSSSSLPPVHPSLRAIDLVLANPFAVRVVESANRIPDDASHSGTIARGFFHFMMAGFDCCRRPWQGDNRLAAPPAALPPPPPVPPTEAVRGDMS